ncbi:MAG: SAVED domain-containing protein, partial [Polyangiaceae bacterium]
MRTTRSAESWQNVILPKVAGFLKDASALRTTENDLLLECHSSVAFLAGYELDRKSGAQVFPVQKGVRTSVWKPGDSTNNANAAWATTTSSA